MISVLFLNTISNFYVYSLTVPSFRKYLQSGYRRFVRSVGSFISTDSSAKTLSSGEDLSVMCSFPT
jgi:hypothetical protein